MSQQRNGNRQEQKGLSAAEVAALTQAVCSLYTRFPTLREEEERWALETLNETVEHKI